MLSLGLEKKLRRERRVADESTPEFFVQLPKWIQRLTNPMGLREFSKLEIPPQEPLVDGLIYTGQLVWWSGGSGVQKSLTSTCLAKCLALGQEFMGLETKQCRGAIFDGEMHPSITQERIKRWNLTDEQWDTLQINLYYFKKGMTVGFPKFEDCEAWETHIRTVQNQELDFVIYDNMFTMCDVDDMKEAKPIIDLKNNYWDRLLNMGVTIIIIDHHSYSGRTYGTSVKRNVADLLLDIEVPEAESEVKQLKANKVRKMGIKDGIYYRINEVNEIELVDGTGLIEKGSKAHQETYLVNNLPRVVQMNPNLSHKEHLEKVILDYENSQEVEWTIPFKTVQNKYPKSFLGFPE